ncbi:MAG: hypothetical protein JJT95_06340 [Pararhodobacter sp.]|nr:hypothetical protein [Pararhodobacter sp.]
MKPDFALNLSHEGAELLRRGAAGWERLGAVRFDQPDLDKALSSLRDSAREQAPERFFTKLVIPASELRYVTVLAPGPTDEARRLQIEAEIEGLTPYAIEELSYDFVVEGDYALVALAAKETLEQAEDFAVNHGLNPVAFVAIPERGAFLGEPFLGETRQARKLLQAGEPVVADGQPVLLAGSDAAAEARRNERSEVATARVAGLGARVARAAPAPQPGPAALPPRPKVEITPRAPAAAGSGFPRRATTESGDEPGGLARVGDLVRRMGNRLRLERAGAAAEAAAEGQTPADTGQGAAETETKVAEKPAPAFAAGAGSAEEKASKKPVAPEKTEKSTQVPVAFSSRRKRPADVEAPRLASSSTSAAAEKPKSGPGGRLAMLPGTGRARAASAGASGALGRLVGGMRGGIGRGLRRVSESGKGLAARARPVSASGTRAAAPSPGKPAEGLDAAGKGLAILGGQRRSAQPAGGAAEPIVPASRPPADETAKATEAEALTIFGARGKSQRQPLGARKGLMAAGGVFLLLGAVAVWALYFDLGSDRSDEPGLAQVAPQDGAAGTGDTASPGIEAPAALPEPSPEAVAESGAESAAAPADTEAADTGALTEPATDDPEALLEQLVRDGLHEAQPAEIFDGASETAVIGEPADQVAGPAEPVQPGEAPSLGEAPAPAAQRLALPAPVERPTVAEVMPVSAPPPPPFGVEFDLGDDGLVTATPEGALSPRGVLVYAGQPAEVPPPRPAGIAPEPAPEPAAEPEAAVEPEPEAAPEAVAEPEAVAIPDDTPRADPALADARPQPRSPRVAAMAETAAPAETEIETEAAIEAPETTEPQPEPGDSSALTSPGAISVAALRPQQRPTDLAPATRAAVPDEIDVAEAMREAVARSLVPSARPEGMSERVRQALAAARSGPSSGSSTARTVRGSDAPQIPTTASVAEQATESGMNLRRINLIGVYGTTSDRRALVRLSNGRIVRVGVGDSLDGGQVAAIGDAELRYVRNGRNQVLRIGGRG